MSYDPTYEKNQQGMNPVVSAQPVPAYAVQATMAQPVQNQGVPYNPHHANQAQPMQQMQYAQPNYSVRPPPGRWKDGICDWPNNWFPSCYCVCCCCYGIWLAAQIAQKVGYSSFQCPVWTYIILGIIGFIITVATGIPEFIYLIPMFFAFFFSIGLRMHIANRENITEFGGCFGECCCAFWCWYCSVAQMARHVYGYTKSLDGDGDPFRPDNYPPVVQQV